MTGTSTHPTPEQLRAFGQGRLASDELAQIEDHVRGCDSCCQVLQGVDVDADTLADLVRKAAQQTPFGDGEAGHGDAPPELADHPRYRILGPLGEGGMGVVYKAEHRLMGRVVALKVINKRLTVNDDAVERFRREVKAAAQLAHPNIVTAHDAEEAGGLHFLVMEYVQGISLDRFVAKRGPLPVGLACHFIRQAALGLQHAHQKGMVHRDIKPHNLMVTRKGQVKILDFGLARLHAHDRGGVTAPNLVVGTPDYLAPEQARNSHDVDIRADLYALGCTFYFLLTGRVPFAGDSPFEKLLAHTEAEAASVTELRADVPPEVAAIVAKLMAKKPADRFQTPSELAGALAPLAKLSADGSERVDIPEAMTPVSSSASTVALGDRPAAGEWTESFETVEVKAEKPKPRRKKRPRRPSLLVPAIVGAAVLLLLAGVLMAKPWRWLKKTEGNPPVVGAGGTSGGIGPGPTVAPAGSGKPQAIVPKYPFRKQLLFVVPNKSLYYPDLGQVRDAFEAKSGGASNVEFHIASSGSGPVSYSTINNSRPPPGQEVRAAYGLEDPIDTSRLDAVIFTGAEVDEFLGNDAVGANVRRLIQDMIDQRKVVASMCMGLKVLVDGGFVDQCRALPKTSRFDYVTNKRQGNWQTTNAVVREGRFVMAPGPWFSEQFVQHIGKALKGE